MMNKEELIRAVIDIDKQIEKNKQILAPYMGKEVEFNSDIWHLAKVTKSLLELRIRLGMKLQKYGIFIM